MMTEPRSGSLSGNQVSTYHENRAERMPDTTFHTKGMLRKLLYFIWEERMKYKRDYERLINQRIIDLEEIHKKNSKILFQQEEIIRLYSRLNKSEASPLKITG